MLAGLRHHAIIARHHQQRMVDATDARQHIGEEFFMPRHVDKAQYAAIRLRPVGVAKIESHAAGFLFRQAVGIDAGNRL